MSQEGLEHNQIMVNYMYNKTIPFISKGYGKSNVHL